MSEALAEDSPKKDAEPSNAEEEEDAGLVEAEAAPQEKAVGAGEERREYSWFKAGKPVVAENAERSELNELNELYTEFNEGLVEAHAKQRALHLPGEAPKVSYSAEVTLLTLSKL